MRWLDRFFVSPALGLVLWVLFAAVILFCALTLSACATTAPPRPVTTVEVRVPVAVKCHPDLGEPPQYPDTDAALKAAPDLFSRVKLIVAGRLMRIAREAELQAAIKACEG